MPSRFAQTGYRHKDPNIQREFERISTAGKAVETEVAKLVAASSQPTDTMEQEVPKVTSIDKSIDIENNDLSVWGFETENIRAITTPVTEIINRAALPVTGDGWIPFSVDDKFVVQNDEIQILSPKGYLKVESDRQYEYGTAPKKEKHWIAFIPQKEGVYKITCAALMALDISAVSPSTLPFIEQEGLLIVDKIPNGTDLGGVSVPGEVSLPNYYNPLLHNAGSGDISHDPTVNPGFDNIASILDHSYNWRLKTYQTIVGGWPSLGDQDRRELALAGTTHLYCYPGDVITVWYKLYSYQYKLEKDPSGNDVVPMRDTAQTESTLNYVYERLGIHYIGIDGNLTEQESLYNIVSTF